MSLTKHELPTFVAGFPQRYVIRPLVLDRLPAWPTYETYAEKVAITQFRTGGIDVSKNLFSQKERGLCTRASNFWGPFLAVDGRGWSNLDAARCIGG